MKARFDGFVIDSETRQLTREGDEIHLSPKAFAVLCALVEKRPNVVPKADLFGQIWPDVFVVEGNLRCWSARSAVRSATTRRSRDSSGPCTASATRSARRPPISIARAAAGAPAPGAARFWLTWKTQTFALGEGDSIIGRDPRSQVWLDHSGVSRRHAQIHIGAGAERPILTDLGSTNGTFVNGERVDGPTPLADGDVIKVGSVSVKFREWTDGASRTKRIRGAARP